MLFVAVVVALIAWVLLALAPGLDNRTVVAAEVLPLKPKMGLL